MTGVLTATTTELLKLQPIWSRLLILGRRVIAALALSALKHDVIARHNPSSFPIANFPIWSLYFILCALLVYSTRK